VVAVQQPSGGVMEEVAGVILAHTTGHSSRRGLVLWCHNIEGNPFLLTLAHGDIEGGCVMEGFLVHPMAASGALSDGPLAPGRDWVVAVWRPLARSQVGSSGVTHGGAMMMVSGS
jgi:hypothetical protein